MLGLSEYGYLIEVKELIINAEQELSDEEFQKLKDDISELIEQ